MQNKTRNVVTTGSYRTNSFADLISVKYCNVYVGISSSSLSEKFSGFVFAFYHVCVCQSFWLIINFVLSTFLGWRNQLKTTQTKYLLTNVVCDPHGCSGCFFFFTHLRSSLLKTCRNISLKSEWQMRSKETQTSVESKHCSQAWSATLYYESRQWISKFNQNRTVF